MEETIQESDLYRLAKECALETRHKITTGNYLIQEKDFHSIAQDYDVKFSWQELSLETDGYYSNELRVITLNSRITSPERRNFSFCHELMHSRIYDTNIYEILNDYVIDNKINEKKETQLIERLCNIGAAEILIPSNEVKPITRNHGFLTDVIPKLCEKFKASSIAVAIQMISTASHSCYLLIAEKRPLRQKQKRLLEARVKRNWQLWVVYNVSSPVAKYNMGTNYPVISSHLMYKAVENQGVMLKGKDDIPRPRSIEHSWQVNCDCLAYRNWVFGFFHETEAVNSKQLKLPLL